MHPRTARVNYSRARIAPAAPQPRLALELCTLPDLEGEIRCGVHNVFEHRTTHAQASGASRCTSMNSHSPAPISANTEPLASVGSQPK